MKEDSKVIVRTAGITLLVVIALCVISYLIMLFCFTAKLGDFFYSLGFENISASLYYRVYEKNDDINYIYKSLSIEIGQGDNSNIVKYYEEFTSDEEYVEFCEKLMLSNEKLSLNILEKSLILDEINTINSNYVNALKNTNNTQKAIEFALGEFKNNDNLTLKNIGGYTLSKVVDVIEDDVFTEESLKVTLQEYFNNLLDIFNENSTTEDGLNKAYLVRLGNRIITVGSNLNNIYLNENANIMIGSNVEKMNTVNSKIRELV